MKKTLLAVILILSMVFVMAGCGGAGGDDSAAGDNGSGLSGELTIAAAASLTDVMAELQEAFPEKAVNFSVTFGGSGALQTQIEEGAPIDLFLSAAQKQMNALEEKDMIEKETRINLLQNKVVLIVPKGNPAGITGYDDFYVKAETIGLGEPGSVPVGQYSEEIFNSLGIMDQVVPKAVYGNDVRTVLTWVEQGEVSCGIVYSTDAFTSDKIEIVAEAPAGSCRDVIYPAALIKDCGNPETAKAFMEFLQTAEAKAIFEKYGFTVL